MNEGEDKKTRDNDINYLKAFRKAGPFFGLGIQLAAAVVIMFFIGHWLDEKWGTTPWMMLAGITFGAAAGLYNFIKTVSSLDKKDENNKK